MKKAANFVVILTIVLTFLAGARSSCYGEKLDLQQCIDLALKENLDIRQEEVQLDISTGQERVARSLFYPVLSLNGYTSYLSVGPKDPTVSFSRSAAVMKQPVYSGGKLTNDLNASSENRQARLFSLNMTKLLIENRVFREYLTCLRFWKTARAYKSALEQAPVHLKAVEEEVAAGKRGAEEPLRWKVIIDGYQNRLLNAEKELARAKIRLNALINRDVSESVEFSDYPPLRMEYTEFMIQQRITPRDRMMDMYLDYALLFSPDYRKRMAEVRQAKYNLLASQGALRPTVDIVSNYGGNSQPLFGIMNGWDAGMFISFDLYKQQKYENVGVSRSQLKSSEVREQQYLRDLRADVRSLYISNASSNEQVRLQRKQQKTAREYLKEISARYDAGSASNLEVVEAFENFYNNQVNLIDTIYGAFIEFDNLCTTIGFSYTYSKPAPKMFWQYRERGLQLDYDLKSLDDHTFDFIDDKDSGKVTHRMEADPSLVSLRDRTGHTALHYAVSRGYVTIAETLLRKGADPEAVDYLDGTPLMMALCICPKESRMAMTNLLIKNRADVNKISHYYPPLTWAAMSNDLESVRVLVQAGAKLDTRMPHLKTTALHASIFSGNIELVRFLVESGADISAENVDGFTPLDLAWQFEFMELVKYLESIGAR